MSRNKLERQSKFVKAIKVPSEIKSMDSGFLNWLKSGQWLETRDYGYSKGQFVGVNKHTNEPVMYWKKFFMDFPQTRNEEFKQKREELSRINSMGKLRYAIHKLFN